MKKLLLASTALLGAVAFSGAASAQQVTTRAPFTLNIGGAFTSYFGVNSGGDEGLTTQKKNYGFSHEALLQFAASAKTDNGLTYGATIRKYFNAGNQAANADYDRSWVYVQGSFGQVRFGDANGARGDWQPTAVNAVGPGIGNGLGADGGMAALFYNTAGTTISAATSMGNYPTVGAGSSTSRRTKLAYISPSFGGFQAGLAYIPSPGKNGSSFDRTDTATSVITTDLNGRGNYRDVIEANVRYSIELSGVKVTPVLSYLTGSAVKTPAGGPGLESAQSLNAGLTVEYAGASLGLGYTNSFKTGQAKAAGLFNDESEGLVVALGYVTGPWAVSGYYQYATAEGNQTVQGDDKLTFLEIAGGYTLAPGLQLWTAVHNYEFKDENVTKRNGTIFLLGTTVSF